MPGPMDYITGVPGQQWGPGVQSGMGPIGWNPGTQTPYGPDPGMGRDAANALNDPSLFHAGRLRSQGLQGQLGEAAAGRTFSAEGLQRGYDAATGSARDLWNRGNDTAANAAAQAQGRLDPYINQDMATRDEYARRLMGDGDNALFNRQAAQGMDAISANFAKSGMLGSTAQGQALSDMGTQLQMGREQRFYDRASGLFNNAAAQSADAYGRFGSDATGAATARGGAEGEWGMGYGRGMSDIGRWSGTVGADAYGGAYRDQANNTHASGNPQLYPNTSGTDYGIFGGSSTTTYEPGRRPGQIAPPMNPQLPQGSWLTPPGGR